MPLDVPGRPGRELTKAEVFGEVFRGGVRYTLAEDVQRQDGLVLEAGGLIEFHSLYDGVTNVSYGKTPESIKLIGCASVLDGPFSSPDHINIDEVRVMEG